MRMSSSVGSGLSRNNSMSVVRIPGVQKPHCSHDCRGTLLAAGEDIGARRDAFDGKDLVPIGLHRQHQARPRRMSVEQNGAGAAYAMLAAEMRAGQAKLVPQEIRKRDADRRRLLVAFAVDRQSDLADSRHVSVLWQYARYALSRARGAAVLSPIADDRMRRMNVIDGIERAQRFANLAQTLFLDSLADKHIFDIMRPYRCGTHAARVTEARVTLPFRPLR